MTSRSRCTRGHRTWRSPSPDGTKMGLVAPEGGVYGSSPRAAARRRRSRRGSRGDAARVVARRRWIAFPELFDGCKLRDLVVKSDGCTAPADERSFDDREPSCTRTRPGSSLVGSKRRQAIQDLVGDARRVLKAAHDGHGRGELPRRIARRPPRSRWSATANTIFTMPANLGSAPTQFGGGQLSAVTPNTANLVYQNGRQSHRDAARHEREDLFPSRLQYMVRQVRLYSGREIARVTPLAATCRTWHQRDAGVTSAKVLRDP